MSDHNTDGGSRQYDAICIPLAFVRITGDLAAAAVLAVIRDGLSSSSDPSSAPPGLAMRASDWRDVLGLSYWQVKRIERQLAELVGLQVSVRHRGQFPCSYYQLDLGQLARLIQETQTRPSTDLSFLNQSTGDSFENLEPVDGGQVEETTSSRNLNQSAGDPDSAEETEEVLALPAAPHGLEQASETRREADKSPDSLPEETQVTPKTLEGKREDSGDPDQGAHTHAREGAPEGYHAEYATGNGSTRHLVQNGAISTLCRKPVGKLRLSPLEGRTYQLCAACERALARVDQPAVHSTQPHILIIEEGWWANIPEAFRPPGKAAIDPNLRTAKNLAAAGITVAQVADFVSSTYPSYVSWAERRGAPRVMSLDHVKQFIRDWLDKRQNGKASGSAKVPAGIVAPAGMSQQWLADIASYLPPGQALTQEYVDRVASGEHGREQSEKLRARFLRRGEA